MSIGLVVVEVCDANAACRQELYKLESEFPGVSVLETACMSECDLCARSPYVFVNGDLVCSDSVEGLFEEVRRKLREILSYYDSES